MLQVSSVSIYFTTNYFPSEAPGRCWSRACMQLHRAAVRCVCVCVWDGDDAAADSLTNECEAATQWTPAAVHFQGLMNLSDGKWGKAPWRCAAAPRAQTHRSFERQNQPEAACRQKDNVIPEMGERYNTCSHHSRPIRSWGESCFLSCAWNMTLLFNFLLLNHLIILPISTFP